MQGSPATRLRHELWWPLLLGALSVGVWARFLPWRELEPDRLYHYALSRPELGWIPRTLAQPNGLGWDQYFPEKEFLFHIYTRLAQRLGGETGIDLATFALTPLIFSLLWLSLRKFTSRREATALLLLGLSLGAVFMARLTLLRPHVFAITWFCFLAYALLRQNSRLVALACFGFTLSYHGFYMPVLLVGSFWLCGGRRALPLGLAGILGIGVGWLLNPYFPSNIVMAFEQLRVLGTVSSESVGRDVLRPEFGEFFRRYGAALALALGAIALRIRSRPQKADPQADALLLAATLLWLLSIVNSRATEYAIPLTPLALAPWIAGRARVFGIVALLTLPFFAYSFTTLTSTRAEEASLREWKRELEETIALLPESPVRVFNCDWRAGPFILYARPAAKFVDLLEPNFLRHARPQLDELRRLVMRGALPNPASLLRDAFAPDFILCHTAAGNAALGGDTSLELLHHGQATGIALFRVR